MKKTLALIIAILMLAVFVVGCADQTTTTSPSAGADQTVSLPTTTRVTTARSLLSVSLLRTFQTLLCHFSGRSERGGC